MARRSGTPDTGKRSGTSVTNTSYDTHLMVLQHLWEDQHQGEKMGLTSKHLKGLTGRSAVTVHDVLKDLRGKTPPLIVEGRGESARGRRAKRYLIDIEAVITWPVTATMVLHLFECEDGMCSKEMLKQQAFSMGVIDPNTGKPFDVLRIEKQIDFAVTQKYLAHLPDDGDLLRLQPRARDERSYLTFVSRHAVRAPA
jgi:hypothetical protein